MDNINFRIGLQSLLRHRRTVRLNVCGFSIALSVVILIGLYAHRELNVNLYHDDVERIYKVSGWGAPYALAGTIGDGVAEIEAVTNVIAARNRSSLALESGKAINTQSGFLVVDPAFFRIFTFPVIRGNADNPLPDSRSVALTRSTAKTLFGSADPIGQTVMTSGLAGYGAYVVTAILEDVPVNSSIRFSLVFRFDPNMSYNGTVLSQDWKSWNCELFAKLVPGADPQTVNRKMQDEVRRRGNLKYEVERIVLYPLSDIYFNRPQVWTYFSGGDYDKVMIMVWVGIIILLIAIINFFNLSTASSMVRSKEIGLRKVNGATRGALIFQFLSESVLVTFLSMVIALLIVNLILPLFSLFVRVPYPGIWMTHGWEWFLLLGGSLFVGCVAGSYPAFYLSGVDPIRTLYAGRIRSGFGVVFFRKVLIVFQLVASIVILSCVFVISGQISYMQNKDMGFDREQILCIGMDKTITRHKQTFLSEVAALPAVRSICFTPGVMGSGNIGGGDKLSGEYHGEEKELWGQYIYIDTAFFTTFGIELVEGRLPQSHEMGAVVLNETAARQLGVDNPLELMVRAKGSLPDNPDGSRPMVSVVGVCRDFNYDLLNKGIEPAFMSIQNLESGLINLRLNVVSMKDAVRVVDDLKRIYQKFNPETPFDFAFLNTMLNQMYVAEMEFQLIFTLFSIFSIVISCFGLLGLIMFSNLRRKKEIGIRKVQGATIGQVIYLLIRGYLSYVGVAFVIAVPIAYYFMSQWLQRYPYRVGLHWWFFASAGAIALLIVVSTVSIQSWRAATVNPIKSLKSE